MSIDITGLDKRQVLIALYNKAKVQGLGFLQFKAEPMSEQEAGKLLNQTSDFDYLHGRVMKVDLSQNKFDPWLYDRDNGENAAANALHVLIEENKGQA